MSIQVIVTDVVRETGGLVFWMDGGDLILKPMTALWRLVAQRGIWSTVTSRGLEYVISRRIASVAF
jgi:hypothetical protein